MPKSTSAAKPASGRRHTLRVLRRGLAAVAIAMGVVVVATGLIMWGIDPDNFGDPGLGMWWAVQTVTTIGYGDVVPTTTAGRIVASLVMILGVAFVSILTAVIVSDLVVRREEEQDAAIEEEELDLATAIQRLDARLERIEAALREGPQEPRMPST